MNDFPSIALKDEINGIERRILIFQSENSQRIPHKQITIIRDNKRTPTHKCEFHGCSEYLGGKLQTIEISFYFKVLNLPLEHEDNHPLNVSGKYIPQEDKFPFVLQEIDLGRFGRFGTGDMIESVDDGSSSFIKKLGKDINPTDILPAEIAPDTNLTLSNGVAPIKIHIPLSIIHKGW